MRNVGLVVTLLGLDATEAGLFLGGSIHDVAQVVGAGFTISPQIGDAATLTKMFRVAMLVPVVFVLALWFRRGGASDAYRPIHGEDRPPVLPFFLIAFATLVLINSSGLIPGAVHTAASAVSSWCLVMSIAALGVKTSLEELAGLGLRPIALLGGEAAFVALYILAVVFMLRGFAG